MISLEILDSPLFMDRNGISLKSKPMVAEIVRQVNAESGLVATIKAVGTAFSGLCLVFLLMLFMFLFFLTGLDDPYMWSFINTLQLITHLQLINVKLPGNAALFFNLLMGLFRFNYLPNLWTIDAFGLKLSPSPIPVFQQAG